MSIGVRCPECGRKYDLQDSLAGSKLQCIDCRFMIVVPGAPPMPKICAVCKVDIAQAQRFKDEAGYYYCGGCWSEMQAALATLPPDVRALRLEILRQRLEEEHRPVKTPRRRPTELVRLVNIVFNTPRTKKQKRLFAGMVVAATAVSFFLPAAAVTTFATFLVLGAFILTFAAIWTFGPPFLDGFENGMNCLTSRYRRALWQEQNRDYRLRWPRGTPIMGLGLVACSWAYFGLAVWRWPAPVEPPAPPAVQDAPAAQPPETPPAFPLPVEPEQPVGE